MGVALRAGFYKVVLVYYLLFLRINKWEGLVHIAVHFKIRSGFIVRFFMTFHAIALSQPF